MNVLPVGIVGAFISQKAKANRRKRFSEKKFLMKTKAFPAFNKNLIYFCDLFHMREFRPADMKGSKQR